MSKRMFRACNTVKLSRAWKRRPWKYMDPTPKPVKIARVPPRYNPQDDFERFIGLQPAPDCKDCKRMGVRCPEHNNA